MPLTPYERETVITMSDGEEFAYVTTWQRRIAAKLRDNPAAKEVSADRCEGEEGCTFRLPARLISIRNPRTISEETRVKLAANAAKARRARNAST